MIQPNNIKASIQRKENLEGKKEKVLNIECNTCSEYSTKFLKNKKCYYCLFRCVKNNQNKGFEKIYIQALDTSTDQKATKLILECFKNAEKAEKYHTKLLKLRETCVYKDRFGCRIFGDYESSPTLNEQDFIDPILLYFKTQQIIKRIESFNSSDPVCSDCVVKIREILNNLLLIYYLI